MRNPFVFRLAIANWAFCGFLASVSLEGLWAADQSAVKAWEGQITIPTYAWYDDINPVFAELEDRIYYPYTRQDHLGRSKTDRTYRALFLENEYLKVTCLPELGGRIHSVFDKTTGEEMFHKNDEIKPALIAMRGAWISGGIEWNVGPQGHTVTIVSPVDALLRKHADGAASLIIGNTEKMFRTRWTVRLTLHPGKAYLDEQVRMFNPTDGVHPYYFWNCTAFPNRAGTRFIYPMTLGCDHNGTSFFRWPTHDGKDMTRLANYPTMSSVFAFECDYDFFGAYDVDRDRGIVSYANHHELKGKKAWTWGKDDFGVVSQMALSDAGPEDAQYIEVQSGPLLTQAEYGMLGPREEVSWREYWYPVHGLGDGFEYATRDVAIQTIRQADHMAVRVISTADFPNSTCRLMKAGRVLSESELNLSPLASQVVEADLARGEPVTITVTSQNGRMLASYETPLDIPVVKAPDLAEHKAHPDGEYTVDELFKKAWLADSQSRMADARAAYEGVLEVDSEHVPTLCALAELDIEVGRYDDAAQRSGVALRRDPAHGLAWYLSGVAHLQRGELDEAVRCGYKAARQSSMLATGYNLVGRALMRKGAYREALAAFERSSGRNPSDTRNRDHRLIAKYTAGEVAGLASEVTDLVAEGDPTDFVPRALDALVVQKDVSAFSAALSASAGEQEFTAIEVATIFADVGLFKEAAALLAPCCAAVDAGPLAYYYLAYFQDRAGDGSGSAVSLRKARERKREYAFPARVEAREVLDFAIASEPRDSLAFLLRGHLCAGLDDFDGATANWEKAVALDSSLHEAWRLLGYHAWKKGNDLKRAEACFRKALSGRSDDQILYRDLAHILAELDRRPEAIELIESMPDGGEPRYDVCLWLAAAYNAQGRYDDSIEFLSKAHFSNWEGSSEPRDIYVEALMARGKRLFEAGRYVQALKDFQTARTYPENLQVGARYKRTDAEPCYWLGQTHLALGNEDQARIAFKEGAVQVGKTGQQFTFIPVSDAQDDHVKQCAAALDEMEKPPGLSHEEAADGFVPIFDGKSLDGWVGLDGDTSSYYVTEGVLVCKATGKKHIFTEKEYANFILRFQIKLDPGGNNGVGIRTRVNNAPHIHGMEIQVLDDPYYADGDPIKLKNYQHHGSIYGVVPAKPGHVKPAGRWNDEEIICSGRHVKVTLNGQVIVDADLDKVEPLDDQEHPGLNFKKGRISLHAHGNYGAEVCFRNLRIKELAKAAQAKE